MGGVGGGGGPAPSTHMLIFHRTRNPNPVDFLAEASTLSLNQTIFFSTKNQLVPRENPKNYLFGVWPYSFPKDGVFCFSSETFGF